LNPAFQKALFSSCALLSKTLFCTSSDDLTTKVATANVFTEKTHPLQKCNSFDGLENIFLGTENFPLLGECLLWVVFVKIIEVAQIIGLLFPCNVSVNFHKKLIGQHFGPLFLKGHPGQRPVFNNTSLTLRAEL
jgi:hypothetical protein